MKHRIKEIILMDGKHIFNPSEEEVKKLDNLISSVVVEETLSYIEYLGRGFAGKAKPLVTKGFWYCGMCDKHHAKDYTCMMLNRTYE